MTVTCTLECQACGYQWRVQKAPVDEVCTASCCQCGGRDTRILLETKEVPA